MLFDILKDNWLTARKAAISDKTFTIKANLLGTVKAEIERIAKDDGQRAITEEDCIATIKKFIKNCDLTIDALVKDGKEAILPRREKNILEDFLPKQMTKADLVSACMYAEINGGAKTMGDYMKFFKENYSGRYDGKLASEVVRECLSKG